MNVRYHRTIPLYLSAMLIASVATLSAQADETIPAKLTLIDVPATSPMSAAAIDLSSKGYTETEYFTEGKAHRYRGATIGALDTASIIDDGWSYKSRVLLRIPRPEKFNGTLVVEWTNVTAGQDIDFAFAEMHDFLTSEGYAIATVSAQAIGVERLRSWSPQRYETLTVSANNQDPSDGSIIDACSGRVACPGDPLSWDIFSQTVAALEAKGNGTSPLENYDVRSVIAIGQSQSAFRLAVYYNTIQPLTNLFDGFVMYDLAPQLRSDQTVPAISVNSEATADLFAPTTTSEFTRVWDLAGAAHSSVYGRDYVDGMVLRDKSLMGPSGPQTFTQMLASQNCTFPPSYSKIETGNVLASALRSVELWTAGGKPAAASKMFARDEAGKVKHDPEGLPEGGLQLPEFSVPTTSYKINGPTIFCTLSGYQTDLSTAELLSRYGNRESYLKAVNDEAKGLIEEGYLLPSGAEVIRQRAEAVSFAD
ncbi:hypothetical protein SAMN04488056_12617 [Cohaesibacter marisflavi]|uniref:Alpha/beta hydrolase domain-containing protein n=1 Tax=Cohaesibacter marisflavi TaxID=655353 RepID=A0A1I5N686_9HYPH|nr:alpha/beta hydrolase domain-containing protein [Cohaesibacter marisflavi]SFP17389.1 hypothetical protein SAMN04488056_12617 [Cohaesibacter marisflavi]